MQCTNVVQIALLGEKYGVQKTLFKADFVIIVISLNYTWNRLWYVHKLKKTKFIMIADSNLEAGLILKLKLFSFMKAFNIAKDKSLQKLIKCFLYLKRWSECSCSCFTILILTFGSVSYDILKIAIFTQKAKHWKRMDHSIKRL